MMIYEFDPVSFSVRKHYCLQLGYNNQLEEDLNQTYLNKKNVLWLIACLWIIIFIVLAILGIKYA